MDFILSNKDVVIKIIGRTGPAIARVASWIDDENFMNDVKQALTEYAKEVNNRCNTTPYGVSYTPNIWGDGWNFQRFGVNQYFLHKAFPDIFTADPVYNSLNFVLGVHPGVNTSSFVSGVGARSLIVAYGFNCDEWSYIPDGSASGTAIIRFDLPELKVWPYFWQQTEYVMNGSATNYMFLVLAADDMLGKGTKRKEAESKSGTTQTEILDCAPGVVLRMSETGELFWTKESKGLISNGPALIFQESYP